MTKADIIELIAERTGLTRVETAAVVDGFMATVQWALEEGNRVELRGFGTFCLRERQEKHIPNPKTGKMMYIPHRVVPDFKPSPQFKWQVAEKMRKPGESLSRTPKEQTDIFSDFDRLFGEPERRD